MATLHIRNVPDGVVAALKERAGRRGRSLNAEVVDLLIQSAPQNRDVDEVLADIRALARTIENPPSGDEIADGIRQDREERTDRVLRAAGRLAPKD